VEADISNRQPCGLFELNFRPHASTRSHSFGAQPARPSRSTIVLPSHVWSTISADPMPQMAPCSWWRLDDMRDQALRVGCVHFSIGMGNRHNSREMMALPACTVHQANRQSGDTSLPDSQRRLCAASANAIC